MHAKAEELLAFFGTRLQGYRFDQPAYSLSYANRRRLEIARALATKPKLLLLDEPSFGLAPLIIREIFDIMRVINRQEGVSILLVEQNVAVSLRISQRAYVLENGRIVMSGSGAELLHDDRVRQAYLGL
jgi:branched-chain amino acid transport system ATP-binding protein